MATPPHSRSDSGEQSSTPQSKKSASQQSPGNWYQRTLNRVSPESPGRQSSTRLRHFNSLKELTKRASRSALKLSKFSPKKDQSDDAVETSPPVRLPGDPEAERCRPPTWVVPTPNESGRASTKPEETAGDSTEHSQPVTSSASPEPANIELLEDGEGPERTNMGNSPSHVSSLLKKPLPAHMKGKQTENAKVQESLPSPVRSKDHARGHGPVPGSQQRPSSVRVQIPRRRSSLTNLHLDRSHFGTPVSSKTGNTDRSPGNGQKGPRPALPSLDTSAQTANPNDPNKTGALSPPLLSPHASTRRPSTSSSQGQSPTSLTLSQIHLPRTFPDGAIEMPTPPLTKIHYQCYQSHVRMRLSPNRIYSVPCMTCGIKDREKRWMCVFCALRVCSGCMAELIGKGRDLGALMQLIDEREEKKDEKEGKVTKVDGESSKAQKIAEKSEAKNQGSSNKSTGSGKKKSNDSESAVKSTNGPGELREQDKASKE